MFVSGVPELPPVVAPVRQGFVAGSIHAAMAALACWRATRLRGAPGEWIDVSLVEALAGLTVGAGAAFTAAVLGGIGSIAGAALGGLILGLLQSVGPALILTGFGVPSPFQLKDAFTFLVLVLVLIFRPGGLLGTGEAEKL